MGTAFCTDAWVLGVTACGRASGLTLHWALYTLFLSLMPLEQELTVLVLFTLFHPSASQPFPRNSLPLQNFLGVLSDNFLFDINVPSDNFLFDGTPLDYLDYMMVPSNNR